jgi:hypothetical protein
MVHPPTTRGAGRMNPAVRFTEASIHSIFHPMTPGKIPANHLDRALMALVKSKSALPRFLREARATMRRNRIVQIERRLNP